jgi:hypothetical protein
MKEERKERDTKKRCKKNKIQRGKTEQQRLRHHPLKERSSFVIARRHTIVTTVRARFL